MLESGVPWPPKWLLRVLFCRAHRLGEVTAEALKSSSSLDAGLPESFRSAYRLFGKPVAESFGLNLVLVLGHGVSGTE